ncbi:MAG: C39 family peptidase [Ardenticatenaceae bacterium]
MLKKLAFLTVLLIGLAWAAVSWPQGKSGIPVQQSRIPTRSVQSRTLVQQSRTPTRSVPSRAPHTAETSLSSGVGTPQSGVRETSVLGATQRAPVAVSSSREASQMPTLLRWRAAEGDFSGWELNNVERTGEGALRLVDQAPNPSNGRFVGEATSPILEGLSFEEAIASWNAQTPTGSWMDVLLRVRRGQAWSEWYYMGIWSASSDGPIQRHSVTGQDDEMARVATDTLLMKSGRADGVQVKLRLQSEVRGALSVVQNVALALSDHATANPTLSTGNPQNWGISLSVPGCSQMVYPDGGEIWCSPTSTSMVLRYWAQEAGQQVGECEPWVRAAVNGVYDYAYNGHGNWPFNVAYASTQGMEGYITRLSGLDEAERWIARGVPLILSYGWNRGELDNAPFEFSQGHIAVLSGFDDAGNPIMHDPGGSSDQQVRRTYRRDQFERLWLSHSAGTTYVMAPPEYFEPPVAVKPMLKQWQAAKGGFSGWELDHVELTSEGALRLVNPAMSGLDGSFYGEATSPIMENHSFKEAIASWNAQTPTDSWINLLLRVRRGQAWSQWFYMGIWSASSDGRIDRHSVSGQQDQIAKITVDTLVMQSGLADAVQLKVRLQSDVQEVLPVVKNVALTVSDHPAANPTLSTGNPENWGTSLSVPGCSQMVYPDGGEIWCSPTSTSMVLRYWAQQAGQEVGECEPWVRGAVNGVYDHVYQGHGNWPFNVAYASTQGMEGYITRLSSLDEAERWIARGIPLILSYGWNPGELDNAPFESSNGHIAVLSGFDDAGNPILHDPGGASDQQVKRTYRRDQFERLWLSHSAGTTYVITPAEVLTPMYKLYMPIIIR